MKFLVSEKKKPNKDVFCLLKGQKEFLTYSVAVSLYNDFFFVLYDEKRDKVIAQCSASFENDNVVEINDVFVYEQFRGKRYCQMLILNVLYHFAGEKMIVKICCFKDNIPAYRCYQKIFDPPYRTDSRYAYFCITV